MGQVEAVLSLYREHLEELVAERTAELSQVNEQLRREIVDRRQAEAACWIQTTILSRSKFFGS